MTNHELDALLKSGSVGSDVEELQTLLHLAGVLPGHPDGHFGPLTEQAVRRFQAEHALHVDGQVGPRTWRALEGAAYAPSDKVAGGEGGAAPAPAGRNAGANEHAAAPGTADFCFPLAIRPVDWRGGYRYFGARRNHGRRKHAGCDLYASLGTQVYAIADGVVLHDPREFYLGTDAIEIRHGNIIVRYGEVLKGSCTLKAGAHVTRGQRLAKIGRCRGITQPMLHFEIYTNAEDTSLLTPKKPPPPYMRRKDVTDPAPYLDRWVHHLPGGG